MRAIRLLCLVCCLAAANAAHAVEPTKLDLFQADTAGYQTYRIPGVVVTKRGTVLAYCEARKSAKSDWGTIDVMLRRSTDGGATFDAPRRIVEPPKETGVTVNNPLAIALPSASKIPVVLDMATSEAAMGKIRMAEKAKTAIPPTWAVTDNGKPTTDPSEAIAGMLLPTGGAKGFGLSFMIDMMCGLLSQGASGAQVRPLYGDFGVPYDCSHLFIAIDVAHFCEPTLFRQQVTMAEERIRAGQRAPGVDRLFTPGEPEWQRRQSADGQVKVDPAVAATLVRLAGELGVTHPFQNTTKEKRHA